MTHKLENCRMYTS